MGRLSLRSDGLKRGPWRPEEDLLLIKYIESHGVGRWPSIAKNAGLMRCGKSCRLRWMNYLRPDIKRGQISPDEEELIIRLHNLLGNRWSLIAGRIPGRTGNEVKNYWNTCLSKKLYSSRMMIPGVAKRDACACDPSDINVCNAVDGHGDEIAGNADNACLDDQYWYSVQKRDDDNNNNNNIASDYWPYSHMNGNMQIRGLVTGSAMNDIDKFYIELKEEERQKLYDWSPGIEVIHGFPINDWKDCKVTVNGSPSEHVVTVDTNHESAEACHGNEEGIIGNVVSHGNYNYDNLLEWDALDWWEMEALHHYRYA